MANHNVLLIEPDPLLRVYFATLLKSHFVLDEIPAGHVDAEELGRLGSHAVIVLDFIHLEKSGFDALSSLEIENPGAALILLCGARDMNAENLARLENRVWRILTRDVSPAILVRTVREAIDSYRSRAANRDLRNLLTTDEKRYFTTLVQDSVVGRLKVGRDDCASLPVPQGLFSKTLAQAKRSSVPVGVLSVGLDGQAGSLIPGRSDTGDILDEFERRLHSRLREADSLWRFERDSLTVLLWNVTGPSGVEKVARDIMGIYRRLARNGRIPSHFKGVSIGASLFPLHGEKADDLIAKASRAKMAADRSSSERFSLAAA